MGGIFGNLPDNIQISITLIKLPYWISDFDLLWVIIHYCRLTGNSVIVVPGQKSGPPALLVAQLFTGAGLPAGALNVLTGSGMSLGAKVAQSPNISYLTYGGNKAVGVEILVLLNRTWRIYLYISSTAVFPPLLQDGGTLCKATAGMGVPVSVSACIGATCPFIIFESADIDSAVDAVIEAAFKKKREVSDINKDLYLLLPPTSLYQSAHSLPPIRSTGCCTCRRVCMTVLWPASRFVWKGWSVWPCAVMKTGPWWTLQYMKLSSRGQRSAWKDKKSDIQNKCASVNKAFCLNHFRLSGT